MDTPPDQDFPSSESFVDCAGVRRHVELDVRQLPNHGYAAEAGEVTTSEHGGYVFKAFAEASGTMALARLRGKVRQGLGCHAPTVTQPMCAKRPHEHATVNARATAIDRPVADLRGFLSALVLAQPSPRAVFGSG